MPAPTQGPDAELDAIRARYLGSDPEFVLPSLAGAIRRLEEAFPRYGSFVMEFIQNADDANSGRIAIIQEPGRVLVLNDGAAFSYSDVASLCRVGLSSKRAGAYIGYLGVGFKSVFLISDQVRVTSGGYSFEFDKARRASAPETTLPWQVIPWNCERIGEVMEPWTTGFEIDNTNSPPEQAAVLKRELSPVELQRRVILFLRNLQTIEIRVRGTATETRLISKSMVRTGPGYEVFEVNDTGDWGAGRGRWVVFRRNVTVPEAIRADPVTNRFDRSDVETREVLVAFRLDDQNLLLPEERGTAHMAVFSYLPLRDVTAGLKFTVQADFLTGPGRASLQVDAPWNRWMARELLSLIVQGCVPAFLTDPEWSKAFPALLYTPPPDDQIFGKEIAEPLRALLQSSPWFVAADGSKVSLNSSLVIPGPYREWLTDADLSQLFPGRHVLDEDVEIPEGLRAAPKWVSDENSFWDQIRRLAPRKATERDTSWFERVYRRSPAPPDGLRGLGKLLCDDFSLASPSDVRVLAPGGVLPDSLKGQIRVAHAALAGSQWGESLSILSTEEIAKLVRVRQVPELKTRWPGLLPEERKTQLTQLWEMWRAGSVPSSLLKFVTLPAKDGSWKTPEQLLFALSYRPDHRLEELASRRLFDQPFGYVEHLPAAGATGPDLESWRQFLTELGVDAVLRGGDAPRVSQRIGVLCTLRYERERGWNPREIEESVKLGYDIDSKPPTEGDALRIEAKGSQSESPILHLTVNEFRALTAGPESYAVYVVTDALSNPELHVVRGADLVAEGLAYSVDIAFEKWRLSSTAQVRFP